MAILTDSLMLDAGAVIVGLLGILYFFVTRHFNHWKKIGVPALQPTPFVGNFKDIALGKKCIGLVLADFYLQAKGQPYLGIFAFDHPILLVNDPELIKQILVKDFNVFSDRSFKPNEKNDPMFAKNLFGMNGQRWRHLRVKLTPTFTSGKMKVMFDLVSECGRDLTNYLDKNARNGEVLEMKDVMARYTTDVIATCAFGIQGNSINNPNSEFRSILKKIFDFSFFKGIKTIAVSFAPKLVSLFNWVIVDEEVNNFLRNVIWSSVEYRQKNGVVRKDFLELLIQVRKNSLADGDHALDGDDFVAQAFVFLAAGFETSSSTLTFALYELALHPELQSRLREEIGSVMEKHGGCVTYDGIQEMSYLDMVVSETLRLYPILPFLDREALQDYTIPGTDVVLEKGTSLMIPLMGLQRDPEFYPDPDRFDPERFTEENKQKRPGYTYMPFGDGPRNCIGNRMGLMQVKVGLVHLLSRYQVLPSKDTRVPLVLDPKSPLLSPTGGLPLALSKVS